MANPPIRRRPTDARSIAEAVFKPAAPAAPEHVRPQARSGVPVAKEQVSLKLDSDVLEFFQEDGAGWQERINDALRQHMARASET